MQHILKEYAELLKRRSGYLNSLSELPRGYISKKTIGNKEYHYLQCRNKEKIESRYIKDADVADVLKRIELRKEAEAAIPEINKRLSEIEKAAKLFNASLFRRLDMLKICAGMDDICREKKESCVSFSDAMTSIEGVPVSAGLQNDLNCWKNGDVSFLTVFEHTLSRYGFSVEVP